MRRALFFILIGTLLRGLYPIEAVWAQSNDNARVLSDIHSAYEGLNFSVAEARIGKALDDYEQFLPAELSEIHVLYALILFARNDLPAAASQLNQALQLTPSLSLDSLDTPPQLLEVFGEIKKNYITQSTQNITPSEVRYLIIHDPRAGAAMRSMIVPGWGQMYKGEKRKGVMLAGLWGITAGGSLVAHLYRKRSKDHYLASETQEQTLERFKEFSTLHKVRNNLLVGAVGVWVYSYIDAIVRGQPVPSNAATKSPVQLSIDSAQGASSLSINWRF